MAYLDFVEVIPGEGIEKHGYCAVIEGHDGTPEIIDDCFDSVADAKTAGQNFKREYNEGQAEQIREAAYLAGMALGCDAYNDVMVY
jgi:hypothetical protein